MRATESGFSEVVYLASAQERITTANALLNQATPDYVLATYLGGVAVECLFHAYRMRAGKDDSAKHDLFLHVGLGGFFEGMKRAQREAVSALLGDVVLRWRNNHRYRSTAAMRSFVLTRGLNKVLGQSATKQDPVRYNAEQLVEAATGIVNTEVTRWNES